MNAYCTRQPQVSNVQTPNLFSICPNVMTLISEIQHAISQSCNLNIQINNRMAIVLLLHRT